MRFLLKYIVAVLVVCMLTGCSDEFIKDVYIGEGNAVVTATLDFKAMVPALDRTRSAGNALSNINSLHVLLYDSETKELIKGWKITDFDISDSNRTDADSGHPQIGGNPDYGGTAETSTKKATFTLPEEIPFGKYYMYAVANIDDLLTNELYGEPVKTVEGLKGIRLVWNSNDISKNGEMLGHFTLSSDKENDAASEQIVINAKNVSIHSWLRRAASKVTVAYDGTNLNDGVTIYLMSVAVKDIPRYCGLGVSNTPQKEEELIHDGETVKYFDDKLTPNDEGELDWSQLVAHPAQVSNSGEHIKYGSDHSESSEALFFYENMQNEEGKTMPSKLQDSDGDGVLDFPGTPDDETYRLKDAVPFGTYIEVKAIYRSENTSEHGRIIYRFMLGKDVYNDYDAERNHHYKLTLSFQGTAKDPDWHIDYSEQILEVSQPKDMDYQGKVFEHDYSWPNGKHNFVDGSEVTVTSYVKEEDKIKVGFKVEYLDEGSNEYKTESDWLDCEESVGDAPYETKLRFKFKNEKLEPDKNWDIDQELKKAPAKSNDPNNPWNLSNPKGLSNIECTANCYMVDAPGWYIFPLVYGNAIHNGETNESSYKYTGGDTEESILGTFVNHLNNPIKSPYIRDNDGCGNMMYAYALWQDVDPGDYGAIVRPNYTWDGDWNTNETKKCPTYIPEAFGGKGGVRFYVNPANIKQGNAVIAISDKAPAIDKEKGTFTLPDAIWSWHIWVTRLDVDEDDKTIEVTAHDTSRKFKFMPMNLGWCSQPGEIIKYYREHKCVVKITAGGESREITIAKKSHISFTRGNSTYYQWGRKDPFVGAENTKSDGNKSWWNLIGFKDGRNPPLLSDQSVADDERYTTKQALPYLIKNPEKWHNPRRKENPEHVEEGDGHYDYLSDNEIYANLWQGRTGTNHDDPIMKTVYDPCPVGYQVCHYNAFSGFTTTGDDTSYPPEWYDVRVENIAGYNGIPYVYTDYLFEFYTNPEKNQSIIFPEVGYRDWDDWSNIYKFNEIGYVWSAGNVRNDDNNSYNFEFSRKVPVEGSFIRPKNKFYPCDGFPVRPVLNGKHGSGSTP